MASINIGGGDDPSYRYKMPRVQGKIEGRGNGIKTVIVNANDVARSLKRPPEYLTKYCAVELGAVSKYDPQVGSGTVNGAHDTDVLQQLVHKFVKQFVLCPRCTLPETSMQVDKRGNIMFDCKACGDRSMADMSHRLCTFILKNPPNEKGGLAQETAGAKAGKKTKEERRAAKAAKSRGEDVDEDGDGDDKDGDDERRAAPAAPASEAPVKQVSEMTIGSSAAPSQTAEAAEDELEAELEEDRIAIASKVEAIMEEAESLDQTVAALVSLGDEMKLSMEDIIGFVFETVFTEDILADDEVKASAKLFRKLQPLCAKEKMYHTVMLVCIENLCGDRQEEALLKKTPLVLKAFYDHDLLDEEAILKWYDKKSKNAKRDVSKKVKKAAEPFITWLKEADEESEDDDDDD
mmetsp:Transcript_1294/g.3725  ORF Transcript_1294/g.3725 Transcript_1294/m.3725 type:complete len:406 (+) Transcript_1294:164-1381(+)|eukprot:CAMPEP_0206033426 /NCGR_PEP_ID=MMETSP1466-20131121/643_1 /ASSEMBLY_ACC=CAM_ASM_001126 /TAXON_ID=44452 /ORGANISM="Pavlova gyrans, Strain CCMP608" /LENGTH=405 /DNA_ID=CAMNT_0053407619 /DNA_START=162 /DNA_END=1379 /DNA_ORIENTATION=-